MAALAPATFTPYLFPLFVAFVMYRRIRRNFGVQFWSPTRVWIRVALLSVVALMLLVAGAFAPQTLPAMGIGLAGGLVLAYFGLRHTHVHWTDGKRSYTPNPWIGGLLSVLLVGRLAWRMTSGGGLAGAQAAPSGITFGIAMALIAYSLVYAIGLIVQMKRLQPASDAAPAA